MTKILVIGLGGFLGAIARYGLSGLAQRLTSSFPLGTLLVNLIGSLLLGFLATLFIDRLMVSAELRLFTLVGLLGAFTTYSTFSLETLNLIRAGEWSFVFLYVGGNFVGGLLAVGLGVILANRL